jgi:hypothetical protein
LAQLGSEFGVFEVAADEHYVENAGATLLPAYKTPPSVLCPNVDEV